MKYSVFAIVSVFLIAGCARPAPTSVADSPRIRTCKSVLERAAGPMVYHSLDETSRYGGQVMMHVTYRTPAGSPVDEMINCLFDGGDEVQQVQFGPGADYPPRYMRKALEGHIIVPEGH